MHPAIRKLALNQNTHGSKIKDQLVEPLINERVIDSRTSQIRIQSDF